MSGDRNHCKHGTFIGDPFGADYLCGYCEDGISDAEYRVVLAYERVARLKASPAGIMAGFVDSSLATFTIPYNAALATAVVDACWDFDRDFVERLTQAEADLVRYRLLAAPSMAGVLA